MSVRICSIAILVSAVLALRTSAAVLVSEVVFNEVGSDTTGEWIEIYNSGATAVDLSNYKIGDEEASGGTSATESIFKFPAGASIGPNQFQIIAVSATRFNTVYGFMPTYESGGTEAGVPDMTAYPSWDPDGGQINMSNTNDQAILVDGSEMIVDAVSWGNTFAFNPAVDITANSDGRSIERISPGVDTNTAADWQDGPNAATAAGRSTPGAPPVPEPATFALTLLGTIGFAFARRRKS